MGEQTEAEVRRALWSEHDACRAELAALRERAETAEEERNRYRVVADAIHASRVDAHRREDTASERVAQLEGRIAAALAIVDAEAASGNTAAVIADVRAALANGKPR